MNIRLQTM